MFADVISPCRVEPASVNTGLTRLGLTYLPGTDHGWAGTHAAWNQGQCDNWAVQKGPIGHVVRDARQPPIPLRVGGCLHGRGLLPLLDDGADQPESLLPVDGLHRQRELPGPWGHRRIRRRAGHLQRPQRQQCILRLGDVPRNYGAWYISQIFDILVSNPNVFSKTGACHVSPARSPKMSSLSAAKMAADPPE